MATGVEVFFTGLMLICFDGQPNCPTQYPYTNTAWVIKGSGNEKEKPLRICGQYRGEKIGLEIKFKAGDFDGWKTAKQYCVESGGDVVCTLPDGQICIDPTPPEGGTSEPRLDGLPRINEIDRRLVAPDQAVLKDKNYISSTLNFPKGEISSGDLWPSNAKPTTWHRSDGNADSSLPRRLSDRLKVAYRAAKKLELGICKYPALITLKPQNDNAKIVFQNVSKIPPIPDYEPDAESGYDTLAYLAWYYYLGEWDTHSGKCPDYAKTKKDAVLLRCACKDEYTSCAHDPAVAAGNRFWPPMLGPLPR